MNYILKGTRSKLVGESTCNGSVSVMEQLENYPGYIHHHFRNAIDLKGLNASFPDLAYQMNSSSARPSEDRPTINLSSSQVRDWFIQNKGKQISSKEKFGYEETLRATYRLGNRTPWSIE